MFRLTSLALAGVLAPAVAAAAIVVERPEVRASIGTLPTTAAYMTLRNTGSAPDKLVSATCACAGMAMIHQSTNVGGVARMAMEASVAIPPGGAVAFAPTGRHIMLTGVKTPIRAGAKVPLVLTFEKAGAMTVVFTASDTPGLGAAAAPDHQHAHH